MRMAKKRADDELLDALYAAAPRAFVDERARVVAALKAAGRGDEARAVGKMKRPSASVWAVNQLARRAAEEVGELIALGASLRTGERTLLGGGDAAGFMDEARVARQKVAALARRAEAIVEESGQQATLALGRKIAQTLQAASIGDDATRAALAAGRLETDLSPPSSFGGGGDLSSALAASLGGNAKAKPAPAARDKSAAHEKSATREPAATRAHAAAERAKATAALRAQRRAQAAERKHAAALERAAALAERAVAERGRAVERARAGVERAEAELRVAKDALAEAELAAAAARRAADDAAR